MNPAAVERGVRGANVKCTCRERGAGEGVRRRTAGTPVGRYRNIVREETRKPATGDKFFGLCFIAATCLNNDARGNLHT